MPGPVMWVPVSSQAGGISLWRASVPSKSTHSLASMTPSIMGIRWV